MTRKRHQPHVFLTIAAPPEPDSLPEHQDNMLLFDDGSHWSAPRGEPRLHEEPRQ